MRCSENYSVASLLNYFLGHAEGLAVVDELEEFFASLQLGPKHS